MRCAQVKLDCKQLEKSEAVQVRYLKITDKQNIVVRKTYDSEYTRAEHTCDNEIEELGAHTLNKE